MELAATLTARQRGEGTRFVTPGERHGEADVLLDVLYGDIRKTLGASRPCSLFTALALRPDALAAAWHTIRPALRFEAFERAAADLRVHARLETAVFDRAAVDARARRDERLGQITAVHYETLPKLCLVATAWHMGRYLPSRMALSGDLLELGESEDHQPWLGDSANTSGSRMLEQIRRRHGHPEVSDYFRDLAYDENVLTTVWTQVEPHVGGSEWEARCASLVSRAQQHVEELFDAHGEATVFDADERHVLESLRERILPDMLLDVAVVRAWLGLR